MSINEFVAFATAPGANVIEQEDYLSDPIVPTGFTMGLLYSAKTNKVWRQSSFVAHCLSELMRETLDEDINDDGDAGTYIEQLKETIFQVAVGFQPINEAPEDGEAYGRRNAKWVTVLNRAGDRMNGMLTLARFPTQAMEAVNKAYVDNLVAGLAPINSPNFTGIPRAPTPPDTTNDTTIPTCAWVRIVIAESASGVSYLTAGPGLAGGGTGNVEIHVATNGVTNAMRAQMPQRTVKANIAYATANETDVSFATFLTELGAAPINSPNFTGVPTVPDAGNNISNQIASTKWVSDRYLKLTGGQLYNPGNDGLFSIKVDAGHDNWTWFYGDNTYTVGVARGSSGGFFGVYSNNYGRWNYTSYPSGLFNVNTGLVWVSTNSPPGDMNASCVVTDYLATLWNLGFNAYNGWNYGWTYTYNGAAGLIAFDGRFIYYTAGSGTARTGIPFRHTATIEWNHIRIVGDNSPSFYATNTADARSWGWNAANGNMNFGRMDDNGFLNWNLGRFDGGDGAFHTYGRAYLEGGTTIYGNDSIYIEGSYTGNARIYYANAARVWLGGTRLDNGHWTLQDVSGGYVEKFRVQWDGNVWCQSGMYADGGFFTGSGSNLGSTWFYGSTWARDNSSFNAGLTVYGYCTVNDFRSNNNVYVPNGYGYFGSYLTVAGQFTCYSAGQFNGGLGVYNGITSYQSLVVGGFAYFQGGGRFYNGNDPLNIGNLGSGQEARIHYYGGGAHYLVGCNANNIFAFWSIDTSGSYQRTYFNTNGDWLMTASVTANGGFYGTVHLARDATELEDAPQGALQIVNKVRPIVYYEDTKFRFPQVDLHRFDGFVRRGRGLMPDQLVEAMGEGFYFREDRHGNKAVDYMELISVLWQSVQELSAQLAEVTSR